jgi:hypothetical protein
MSPGSPPSLVVDPQGTTAISFFAYDSADRRFCISGRIDPHSDYLTFRIVTRILSTGEKSAVKPEELFDAMMAHFGQQPGGLPEAIRGIWDSSDPEFVTNLERFNAALAAGNDEATAARATFTGRMATKYGYNTVVVGVTDPPNGPPPYTKVNVYFKK